MNFFQFTNGGNGNGDGSGSAFQSGGWNATTDGAIWISTGGATPVLNTQDLNFQLDYRSTPTSAWITLTGAYLLSNGVAQGDVTVGSAGYPGYWMGIDGATAAGETTTPTPRRPTGSRPRARGSTTCPAPSRREARRWARRRSRGCSLTYTPGPVTTTASLPPLARARVAISGAFQVGGTAYNDSETPPQTAFLDMPSMVLKPTIPGDANLDGKVDVNDLTIVLSNFGQTAGMDWSTGDFNGDGRVDVNDLTTVLSAFRQQRTQLGRNGGGARAFCRPADRRRRRWAVRLLLPAECTG